MIEKEEDPIREVLRMRIEAAERHVKENILYELSPKARCVDGGYRKDQAGGEIAFPGADAGHAMVLMAHGISPEQAFALTAEHRARQLVEEPENALSTPSRIFFAHDDTHENGCGCGHCKKGQEIAEEYGLANGSIDVLLALIAGSDINNVDVHNTILERDHEEQGILVINDTTIDVLPWSEDGNQFFVYAAARHEADLRALADYVNSTEEHRIDPDAAWQTAQLQTNQTLARLGTSAGAPMYEVNLTDTGIPTVEFLAYAPTLDAL